MGTFARTPSLAATELCRDQSFVEGGMKQRARGEGAFTLAPAAGNFELGLISDHLAVTDRDIDFNSVPCFEHRSSPPTCHF